MPFIEEQSEVQPLAIIEMEFEATAEPEVTRAGRATIQMEFTAGGQPSITAAAETQIEMVFTVEAFGGLQGDPDSFGEAEIEMEFTAVAQPQAQSFANALIEMEFTATAEAEVAEPDIPSLTFIVDIVAPRPAATQEYTERLWVDDEEIDIEDWEIVEDPARFDRRLSVTLANIEDGVKITKAATLKFETARMVDGDWVWTTRIESGYAQNSTFSISVDRGRFSFTGINDLRRRLNRSPERRLVIYDPLMQTLDESDFDVIRDTEGRTYPTQLIAVPNLTVRNIFDMIFRDRCGYTSVRTDLPVRTWPLTRIDFEPGTPYIAAIIDRIGLYRPDYEEVGNVLWIRDGTTEHPTGFPVTQIPDATIAAMEIQNDHYRIDGYDVGYVERRRNWDFFTYLTLPMAVSKVEPIDFLGESTTIQTTQTLLEFRRDSNPTAVIGREPWRTEQRSYKGATLIEHWTETYTYNGDGHRIRRSKDTAARVPSLATGLMVLRKIRKEIERWEYRGHPFSRDKMFMRRRTLAVSGEYTIDNDNLQLGQPFTRDTMTAYRVGSLVQGMGIDFGVIHVIDERIEPLTKEIVRIRKTEFDMLAGTVASDSAPEIAGDIGFSALINRQEQVYVFDDENTTRSTERMEFFNGGELPLVHLLKLCRRELRNRKNKPGRKTLEIPGLLDGLARGVAIEAVVEDEGRGTYSVEGMRFRGSPAGHFTQITGEQKG